MRRLRARVRRARVKDSCPMFWRALRVAFACGLVAAIALPACGGNSSDPGGSSGGSSGSGGKGSSGAAGTGSTTDSAGDGSNPPPEPVVCGKSMCKPVVIPQVSDFAIPGCCADAATNTCGLDSSVLAMFGPTFAMACQPLGQPGVKDASCPNSPATPVAGTPLTIKFPGCCRANGECGYQLDSIGGVIALGLGCVDSAPFLDGGTPASCGDNAGGEGGMGGAGPTMSDGGVAGTTGP